MQFKFQLLYYLQKLNVNLPHICILSFPNYNVHKAIHIRGGINIYGMHQCRARKNRRELERYIKVERITRLSVFTANATHLFISA